MRKKIDLDYEGDNSKIETSFENNDELLSMVTEFAPKKLEFDKLKKEVDKMSTNIKEYMVENGSETIDYDGYTLSCSKREYVSMDTEKAIEVLKNNGIDAIKTIEVLDEVKLEQLIYGGEVSKEILQELNNCRIVKTSHTLTMKKSKGGKE